MLAEAKAQLNKYEKDVARLSPLAQKRAIPNRIWTTPQASVEVGNGRGALGAGARGVGHVGPGLLRREGAHHG
jgi:hypothetical protein